MIMIFTWGHTSMRNQKLQCSFPRKFSKESDEVWCAAVICWSAFHSSSIQRRELYVGDLIFFYKEYVLDGLAFGRLWNNCFQTWLDDRRSWILHFDTSVNDRDVHSRPQVYVKAGTCAIMFCKVAWSRSNILNCWLCERWLQINPAWMAILDHLSICSSWSMWVSKISIVCPPISSPCVAKLVVAQTFQRHSFVPSAHCWSPMSMALVLAKDYKAGGKRTPLDLISSWLQTN